MGHPPMCCTDNTFLPPQSQMHQGRRWKGQDRELLGKRLQCISQTFKTCSYRYRYHAGILWQLSVQKHNEQTYDSLLLQDQSSTYRSAKADTKFLISLFVSQITSSVVHAQHTSMQLNTLNPRAAASVTIASLGRTCKDGVQLLALLSEAEAALQKSGEKNRKWKLTSVLNTAYTLPKITRTQRLSCIRTVLHTAFLRFAPAVGTKDILPPTWDKAGEEQH